MSLHHAVQVDEETRTWQLPSLGKAPRVYLELAPARTSDDADRPSCGEGKPASSASPFAAWLLHQDYRGPGAPELTNSTSPFAAWLLHQDYRYSGPVPSDITKPAVHEES